MKSPSLCDIRTSVQNKENGEIQKNIPAGAASLAKGLSILDVVANANEPLRFTELHRQLGFPKPTTIRLLRTLMAFDLIQRDTERRTYSLGHRFLEISHQVWHNFNLQAAAAPELERLSQELGETIVLCQLDGDRLQYLDERSGGGVGVRVHTRRHAPLHCTAGGKALLAFLDPAEVRGLLERLSLEKQTKHSITHMEELLGSLALTRARGYSVSFEEYLEGVNSVGCSITGYNGVPIGALEVLGPSDRLNQSLIPPTGRELIAAARRITGQVGYTAISTHPKPSSKPLLPAVDLECVLPWGAQLGEAPIWHKEEEKLYWVDILHPSVYRFDPKTGHNDSCELNKLVSAVLCGDDGSLRVATQDGIETLDFMNRWLTPYVNPEPNMLQNRLNDAKVGPDGAIWVGSMCLDASKPSGGLYRVSSDCQVQRKESNITVSNGMDWSPEKTIFYFVDTIPGHIYAYDCDAETGNLDNKRVFVTIPNNEGRPDGLCVDAEGAVWCAVWDGWQVRRYMPNGDLERTIYLPVPRPTSVAFGGSDLRTLFITSARTRLPSATLAEAPFSGGVFACTPGPHGIPPHLFCCVF